MKLLSSQFIGASVLAFSLALVPSLSASAQTSPTAPDTTTPDTTVDTDTTEDRDFDWGWLGLIGLAGLAGLRRKHDEPTTTTTYRDPAEPTTRSRY
jgi:MYXO-CTERM domain-containing protein